MEKIGILAFFHPKTRNYGAILQTYALSKTVQQLGYDVELIDIRDTSCKKKITTSIKNFIKGYIEGNPFRSFLKKEVTLSKPLNNFSELQEQASAYYAVIVGSDQVWRPEYCGNLALHYFLDFVPNHVKRIAYAASFGLDEWTVNKEITATIKKEIKKFKAVSVREYSGLGICKETFEINASHTLDPTLLADKKLFYNLISKRETKQNIQQQYIASFVLDRSKKTETIDAYISKQMGKPVHSINKRQIWFLGRKLDKFYSVKEWLRKLQDAEMVVTDSFHCVCFSLIFQKKFICIGNKARGLTRLNSLLKIVELEDRLFLNFNELENSEIWESEINYNKVNLLLKSHKEVSIDFIKTSLNI